MLIQFSANKTIELNAPLRYNTSIISLRKKRSHVCERKTK